jgi:hypothetical protein
LSTVGGKTPAISFFHEHDNIGNEMENDELRRLADPIRAMVSQWR